MSVEDYIREKFNAGAEIVYADRHVTASELVDACDFLKIDTDGHDLKALHGAERLIAKARPLVIITEAHFNGSTASGQSTISGVDTFLRERDYTWLDIDISRYSRGSFPQKFLYNIPAATERGPIGFGDVTHIDDPLSSIGKLTDWLKAGLQRPLKLLAFYDLLGFPDCAAELIVALSRHPSSAHQLDWRELLLTIDPNYNDRVARFKADPKSFFPT